MTRTPIAMLGRRSDCFTCTMPSQCCPRSCRSYIAHSRPDVCDQPQYASGGPASCTSVLPSPPHRHNASLNEFRNQTVIPPYTRSRQPAHEARVSDGLRSDAVCAPQPI